MTTNKASKFFGVINTQAVYIGDHKLRASDVENDSTVAGSTVKEALDVVAAPSAGNIIPGVIQSHTVTLVANFDFSGSPFTVPAATLTPSTPLAQFSPAAGEYYRISGTIWHSATTTTASLYLYLISGTSCGVKLNGLTTVTNITTGTSVISPLGTGNPNGTIIAKDYTVNILVESAVGSPVLGFAMKGDGGLTSTWTNVNSKMALFKIT